MATESASIKSREFGAVNWLGLWTLLSKEVMRFMRIFPQTLLAPMISNLLFLIVFLLAFSGSRAAPGEISFGEFLVPGLIMMGILNNASANSSSSLMSGKLMGSIQDVLMPPLSPSELAIGYIGGAAVRGMMVGICTSIGLLIFVPMVPQQIWAVIYFSLAASTMMGMVGLLAGLWAEKFDHLSVVNNFIILPLSMLSGTFYSISILPEPFHTISLGNPFFYVIDGFRYGFTGIAEGNLMIGVGYTLILNVILFIAVLAIFRSGWRLKA